MLEPLVSQMPLALPPALGRLTLHIRVQDHEQQGPGQCGCSGHHPRHEQVNNHQAQVLLVEAALRIPLYLGRRESVSSVGRSPTVASHCALQAKELSYLVMHKIPHIWPLGSQDLRPQLLATSLGDANHLLHLC